MQIERLFLSSSLASEFESAAATTLSNAAVLGKEAPLPVVHVASAPECAAQK
jgi:hypothetical protein